MLGIVIALDSEINNLLKNSFKDIFNHNIQNHKFYVVTTNSGQSAVLSFCGVGKTNAAMITTLMINSFNIKGCINIGSAGIYKGLDVKQILVGDKVFYGDVDVTGFGYEINQVPKMPKYYIPNNKFNDEIIKMMNFGEIDFKLGNIYTSDSFINSNNFTRFNIPNSDVPIVIDMEAASIGQVCYQLDVPFCSIKVGVDKLYESEQNEEQFNKNLMFAANTIDLLVPNLIDTLSYYIIDKKINKGD